MRVRCTTPCAEIAADALPTANQDRVTAENVAKAEGEVQRLIGRSKAAEPSAATPPNGNGENPPEPTSTPKDAPAPTTPVPSEAVDEKLESVKESVEVEAGEVEAEEAAVEA